MNFVRVRLVLAALCVIVMSIALSACGQQGTDLDLYGASDVESMSRQNLALLTFISEDYLLLNMGLSADEFSALSQDNYESMDDLAKDALIKKALAALLKYNESTMAGIESFFTNYYQFSIDGKVYIDALNSYYSSYLEIGDFLPATDPASQNVYDVKSENVTQSADSITFNYIVGGSVHDAELTVIYDDNYNITSYAVTTKFTMTENMGKAGLNTLLGMGTAFAVLIIVMIVIYAMRLIPKLLGKSEDKGNSTGNGSYVPATDTGLPVIFGDEAQADLAQDLELVAVIAAAVAASEGTVSADGIVVRSIRRKK